MTNITEKYFDIVDEFDQPLGFTLTRTQVHKDLRHWHRVTGIYIINQQNQFLCQQRSLQKDVDPGLWQNHFGGHCKAGENFLENALSELQEEIGLTVKHSQLIYLGTMRSEPYKHFAGIYLIKSEILIQDLHFNDGEVQQVKWMTWEQYVQIRSAGSSQALRLNPLVAYYLQQV